MTMDAFDEARRALDTAIGSAETELRQRLGNAGYEDFKRRNDALCEYQLESCRASVKLAEAQVVAAEIAGEIAVRQVDYVMARAWFWRAISFAIAVAALLGLAWSIWMWS